MPIIFGQELQGPVWPLDFRHVVHLTMTQAVIMADAGVTTSVILTGTAALTSNKHVQHFVSNRPIHKNACIKDVLTHPILLL